MNYDIVICFRIDDLESAKNIKDWLENYGFKNRVNVCSVNFGVAFGIQLCMTE